MKVAFTIILISFTIMNKPSQDTHEDSQLPAQYYFKYRFGDSSVPPRYHRSYFIEIADDKIHFVVDSYGDILLDKTFDIEQYAVKDFENALLKLAMGVRPEKISKGCTGGTTDSFWLEFSDGRKLNGHVYNCGGEGYGNLKGKIKEAKGLFQSMVPGYYNLMKELDKIPE